MQECWKDAKNERPSFRELQGMLQVQYDDVLRSETQKGAMLYANPSHEELADRFDVSLNPDVNPSTVEDGGESDMALAFASWTPEAESSRLFKPGDVHSFLNSIEKDLGSAKVNFGRGRMFCILKRCHASSR
eukprot:328544-Hanusia_phi.AAC.1